MDEPRACATCDGDLGTVYIVDYNLPHHLGCFLNDLDLDQVTVPTVAEDLKRFAHREATRAVDMVLGT